MPQTLSFTMVIQVDGHNYPDYETERTARTQLANWLLTCPYASVLEVEPETGADSGVEPAAGPITAGGDPEAVDTEVQNPPPDDAETGRPRRAKTAQV